MEMEGQAARREEPDHIRLTSSLQHRLPEDSHKSAGGDTEMDEGLGDDCELDSCLATLSSIDSSARTEKTPGTKKKRPCTPMAPRQRKNSRRESLTYNTTSFKCEEVMEYAVDTYQWKKSLEPRYRPRFSKNLSTDVTPEKRRILMKWLVTINRKLKYSLETFCLTVNYFDRFAAIQALDTEVLQLSGLCAFFLAAKIEEYEPPNVSFLVKVCKSIYTPLNFKHMEVIMLDRLKYQLQAPTPGFLLFHLVEVEQEKDWPTDLSRHMVEMCLTDPVLSTLPPSQIALAVYSVIKVCDASSLQDATINCPICTPDKADLYTREFVGSCFQQISESLIKEKEAEDEAH